MRDVGMQCFKDVIHDVVTNDVRTAVLDLIQQEREGGTVNHGLLKSEARRRKIQNVVKHMKASGMSPEEFERLAAEDEPFQEAMGHDRAQSFLRQLRKSRAPK